MAIVFPASPSVNDTFTAGSITYKWDGDKWIGLGVTPQDKLIEGSNSLELDANNDLVYTAPGTLKVNSADASGYIAEFNQTNTSNSAQILLNSPTNDASRPPSLDLSRAGNIQWSIGQGYNDTSNALHISTTSLAAGFTNTKVSISTDGVVDINKASAAGLVVGGNGGGGDYHLELGQLGTNGSGGINATGTSTSLKFQINGGDIARFDSAGRLLVGNTSATINEAKIEAYADNTGNADVLCLYNKNTATGNTANILFAPSNQVAGARIICEAMEDFSTSANRTADLSFVTRQDGTLAEAARMSSAGYFTVPRQPSFRAGRNSNYTPGALTDIIFNITSGTYHHNNGGHYSTSNGRFTAPVAGMYTFSASVIWQSLTSGQAMDDAFKIMVNGNTAGYSFRRAEFVEGTTGNSGYFVDFGSYDIYLEANEYVTIQNRLGNLAVHGNQYYTTFSGSLIA